MPAEINLPIPERPRAQEIIEANEEFGLADIEPGALAFRQPRAPVSTGRCAVHQGSKPLEPHEVAPTALPLPFLGPRP